ncbi:PepSY domain-containing protein [Sphingomonas gilva]|nr:PepSY domain-containing protein [Sphingomonas gilva]
MIKAMCAALMIAIMATSAVPQPAFAQGKRDKKAQKARDHDLARQAVLRGEVLPLARILSIAQRAAPGDVIEVELESKNGQLFYEVELLTRSGVIRKLSLDARTGALLRRRPK